MDVALLVEALVEVVALFARSDGVVGDDVELIALVRLSFWASLVRLVEFSGWDELVDEFSGLCPPHHPLMTLLTLPCVVGDAVGWTS